MTTTFTSKQPYEAYAISFDFTTVLGAETISTATITAVDQSDLTDVSTVVLDSTKQSNSDTVVYGWVRAGTSGHEYLITCQIVGSLASQYELEGVLPVLETPSTGTTSTGPLVTAPAIEPVALAELKLFIRQDSGSLADNLDSTQSIAPGSHTVADNYTTHAGTAVDVLGYPSIVYLKAGTNSAGGTVDCKIQESDNGTTWTDVTSGAFTQVTTANDNATYEKPYTGNKQYIRAAAKVLVAACEFGTDIVRQAPTSIEDTLLTEFITAARLYVEAYTRRALISQTWDYSLSQWPSRNYIELPLGNLQSVTSVKWTDSSGTVTTLTVNTDYIVEADGDQVGRIVLPYGKTWPAGVLYPSNPITIRYVCGYGDSAIDVPAVIKVAIKMVAADMWSNREAQTLAQAHYQINRTVENLLWTQRLWTSI